MVEVLEYDDVVSHLQQLVADKTPGRLWVRCNACCHSHPDVFIFVVLCEEPLSSFSPLHSSHLHPSPFCSPLLLSSPLSSPRLLSPPLSSSSSSLSVRVDQQKLQSSLGRRCSKGEVTNITLDLMFEVPTHALCNLQYL